MITQSDSRISIKGIPDGLLITIDEGPIDQLIQLLDAEVSSRRGFFSGSKVALKVGGRQLDPQGITRFKNLLASHRMELWAVLTENVETMDSARTLELATRLPGSNVDLDGNVMRPELESTFEEARRRESQVARPDIAESLRDNCLLVRETLRSGRSIAHHSNVVVLGDVNPGAEIIAAGNVIVWGMLRGLVHAGSHGDETAVICALGLVPTQLRIADYIAISPVEKQKNLVPEIAYVQDQQIVADAWTLKR
jgi:septum site-determining protein MinC